MKKILVLLAVVLASHANVFSQKVSSNSADSKFLIQAELGLFANKEFLSETKISNSKGALFVSSYYRLNEHVATGIKIGYLTGNYELLPLAASFRVSLLKSKHELLLITSIGYSPKIADGIFKDVNGGMCADFSIQGNFNLSERLSLLVGPTYYIQEYSYMVRYLNDYGFQYENGGFRSKQTKHEIGFIAGLEFKL